jgi:hypothetical protein
MNLRGLSFEEGQPEPTRPLATKHVQLVTEGEVLQFKNSPTTEAAGNHREDRTHELEHAGDTTAALPKTLDFWRRSEFLVSTTPSIHLLSILKEWCADSSHLPLLIIIE